MATQTLLQLQTALERMGYEAEPFDPFTPPKTRVFGKRPRTVDTPGEPYPPGYYTEQAVKSLQFDRWVEQMETQRRWDRRNNIA